MDPHTQFILGMIVIALLSLAWHEAAHAWVADRLGDPTARRLGRVSLNPIRHLDPFLSLILPYLTYLAFGLIFGGGKPVPINPAYFRHKARDFMFVALAGPFSNLLLAAGFCLLYVIIAWAGLFRGPALLAPHGGFSVSYEPSMQRAVVAVLNGRDLPSLTESWIVLGFGLNVLLAVFNLMPIPPLDGSRFVGWLLPRQAQPAWYRLDRLGLILIALFLFALGGFAFIFDVLQRVVVTYASATDFLVKLRPFA